MTRGDGLQEGSSDGGASGGFAWRRSPFDRLLRRPVALIVLGVLALVQAVTFAEAFTGNLETVLRYGARISDLLLLQLFEMPDTLPLTLPLALGLGLYLAIAAARAQGALVALAAAGVAPLRLMVFALTAGAIGGAAIVAVTGEVLPRARFAERALLHEMQTYSRLNALDSAAFGLVIQEVPGLTLIFGANGTLALADTDEVVLINHREGQGWRYAHAASAEAIRPDPMSVPTLRLIDARAYGLPGAGGYGTFRAEEMTVGFASEDYLPTFDDRRRPAEIPQLTCLAMAIQSCAPSAWTDLLRAGLMAPLAAFLAVAGIVADGLLRLRGMGLILAMTATVASDMAMRAAFGAGLGAGLGAAVLIATLAGSAIWRWSARLLLAPADR
jgi:hypothetical protein